MPDLAGIRVGSFTGAGGSQQRIDIPETAQVREVSGGERLAVDGERDTANALLVAADRKPLLAIGYVPELQLAGAIRPLWYRHIEMRARRNECLSVRQEHEGVHPFLMASQ